MNRLQDEIKNETTMEKCYSSLQKMVEMNSSIFWKSIQRSQKKRKTIRLKKNASQRTKPAVKKSNHVSRSTQKDLCKEVNQPSITINSPLMMDETLPRAHTLTTAHALPILLDKSTVPRGQMLPVCQDQFLSASFQFVENNWINSATPFMNATSCVFTSAGISHTFVPSQSSSHMLWDATSRQVAPVTFLSGNCGQAYTPPEKTEVCYTDLPQVSPPDSVSVEDLTSQLVIPSCKLQSEPSSSDDLTLAVSEALCDSRLFQDGDNCSSSPLTDSQCDVVSPVWLDLLLDSSNNLCFPDPNLVAFGLSPERGSD